MTFMFKASCFTAFFIEMLKQKMEGDLKITDFSFTKQKERKVLRHSALTKLRNEGNVRKLFTGLSQKVNLFT